MEPTAEEINKEIVETVFPPPEKPKLTLEALLAAMQAFDDGMAVDFDPAQVVGDLKDKVDAIKSVIDRLEFQTIWARQQAEPFMKAAYRLEANTKRLKEFVTYTMQAKGFEELPGNVHRAQLQNNPPSLELTNAECTAADFVAYPNYAKQIRYYEWDTKAIKDALVSKRKDQQDEAKSQGLVLGNQTTFVVESIPFARLNISRSVRFYIQPPAKAKK